MSGVELDGKVAIITGAASGMGAAAAMEFVRRGAKVGLDHSLIISADMRYVIHVLQIQTNSKLSSLLPKTSSFHR